MSLETFEAAWVDLMLDPALRERWRDGRVGLDGLTQAEEATLKGIEPWRMEAMARTVIEGRVSVFLAALPGSVKGLLPETRRRELAQAWAARDPLATLYPFSRTLPPWLDYLAEAVADDGIPHLVDLLHFEALQSRLSFYRRPDPVQRLGPLRLIDAAGLLVAGPALVTVLKRLEAGQAIAELPESPQQGYLVRRTAFDTRIETLHWSVYELLLRCRGDQHWAELVAALCAQHPQLQNQQQTLLQWENHFLRQGLLTSD